MSVDVSSSSRRHPRRRLLFPIAAVAMNSLRHRPIRAFAVPGQRRRPRAPSSGRHHPTAVPFRSVGAAGVRPRTGRRRLLHGAAPDRSLDLTIPTPEDMEDVGGLLSWGTAGGDVVLLDGDLGAGKTCFSRGFVRARTGASDERVTSPTYLLSNAYPADGGTVSVRHMDLYRLSGTGDDLAPLDLERAFRDEISLVEWPSRLGEKPEARLDVTLSVESTTRDDYDGGDADARCRFMKLVPHGDRWVERLHFLESEGYFEGLIVDSSNVDG